MKLTKVRITEFQSILDSTEFDVGDITCLVGKNEAGKTALLKALYRLKPIVDAEGDFDVTNDYPRRAVTDYQDEVAADVRDPANIVQATYALEPDDIAAIEEVFGTKCLADKPPIVILKKGYSNTLYFLGLAVDQAATMQHLVQAAGLPNPLMSELLELETAEEMVSVLTEAEQMEASVKLLSMVKNIADQGLSDVIYRTILASRIPKLLYFDQYYQMKGQDNIDELRKRVETGQLNESDHPLLGLLELARLNLCELTAPKRTEALLAKLEAAENQLTDKVLRYWSQNRPSYEV